MADRAGASPFLVWLAVAGVWGTSWAVIRIGLRDLPPLTFAATRTAVAAVVLVSLAGVAAKARRPSASGVAFWAVVGVPQLALPYALIFWAEQTISSGLTAMLFATFPAFTAVAAHFMLSQEPLTPRKVAGTLLAIVAVFLLVEPAGAFEGPAAWPVVAVLAASGSGAVGAVLVRRHGRDTSTLWLTAIQIAAAALFLTLLAALLEHAEPRHLSLRAVGAVLYLGLVVTTGCYLSIFWLLKRLDATFVSMSVVLETAVAVFLGAGLLQEPLGVRAMGGFSLVALSVALVNLPRRTPVA